MNILIPIETASRELLYKTYLCHLLALKGFNCYLGSKQNIQYMMNRMKNFIYLDKGYHKDVSDKIYEIIKKKGGLIVNLDEEGGIDYPDNSTLKGRYSKELFEKSDFVFLWGKHQYSIIKSNIVATEKILITGHPRFELLKKKYQIFYMDEVNAIKEQYPNFILINTNFGFGNNIKGDEFVIENYQNRFTNIQKKIDLDKTKRDNFVILVKKIASILGKKIVFRPHPEEDICYYQKIFSDTPNVHVIFKGSVVPWIIASEVMIHPDCTTSIESLLIGKKSISYLPVGYDKNLITQLPLEASIVFTNIDKLINFLEKDIPSLCNVNISDYPFIEDYFSYSKNSSELIVEQLNQKKINEMGNHLYKLHFSDKIWLNMKAIKNDFLFSKKNRLQLNKLEGLNRRKIERIRTQMISSDSKFENILISKVCNKLFLISNHN